MIADIEFRWVKRDGKRKFDPINGADLAWIKRKKVLQFRKCETFDGSPRYWTDWQDVPVVEE